MCIGWCADQVTLRSARCNDRDIKYLLFLSYFLDYLDRYSKTSLMSNFMKIRPVGAELFDAGRQTDRQRDRNDEANRVFFLNFA